MENNKIKAVKEWKISTKIKEVESFLEFANFYCVRHSSHWGRSLQNGLRVEQTYGMTLASAYMLCHLSAVWLQLQMIGRSLRWK